MFISLLRDMDPPPHVLAAVGWQPQGEMGEDHPAGQTGMRGALHFVVSQDAIAGAGVLGCAPCAMPPGPLLLRVDEVCFPVGAVAHRHTHAGAGFRHLVRGSLRIEADDHSQIMGVGDTWYEGAGSPVRAVALQDSGVTSFVRGMVVPAPYAGWSTFALMDTADAALPRLQMTHRHIDLPFQLDAG